MSFWPETQSTLLKQLADPRDEDAWVRFDALYRPVVYRYARSQGLQHSDADALVAEVMSRVFRAATRWSRGSAPEDRPTRFTAWLRRVAENALLNLVTRQIAKRGTGGTSHQISLAGRAAPDDAARQRWETEHRRHLFAAAALSIQSNVDADHWAIFWQTHVDGVSIEEAAQQTSRSIGSVYAIRSRLLRKLRETVRIMERLEESETEVPR